MVYATLGLASEIKDERNNEFLYIARDLFDLYRALIESNDNISETILYNDTRFLAHHLYTLAMQYEKSIPTTNSTFTFLDIIPLLYSLGGNAMNNFLVCNNSNQVRSEIIIGSNVEKKYY